MQDYLQRTRLAGRMDEAGSTLALLTGSVVFFLLLWGVRITAVLAGIAAFALLMLLRARTRDRRLQNREDRLRRQIGGEMKLEAWVLMPPRRAHFEAALLVTQTLNGQMLRALDTGVLCAIQGKQALLACAQLPAGEKLTARDIAAFQRACLAEGAETGVLCGAEGLTDTAKQQATLYPRVHSLSRARMIALAGAAFPATDAQTGGAGQAKAHARACKNRPAPHAGAASRQAVFAVWIDAVRAVYHHGSALLSPARLRMPAPDGAVPRPAFKRARAAYTLTGFGSFPC